MDQNGKQRDIFKLYTPPPKENNASNYKRLIIVIVISVLFIFSELIAGVIANSISIISDAVHLICDVLGYFSSFLFLYLAKKAPTSRMTFGFHRMELLGALANIFIVWTLILFVAFQATHRVIHKEFVEKPLVMLIAAAADLVVNIAIFKVLHEGHNHSHGLLTNSCNHSHSHSHHHHHHHHHEHEHHDSHKSSLQHSHSQEQTSSSKLISFSNKKFHSDQQLKVHHLKEIKKKQDYQSSGDETSLKDGLQKKHDSSSEDNCEQEHSSPHIMSEQELKEEKGKKSIGMQAAVLHALSDMIMSIGLIISSLVIFFLGNPNNYDQDVTEWNAWHLFDPIATYIFSITALISTLPIISNSYRLIMDIAPDYIDIDQFEEQLENVPGVIEVSKVHLWQLKPGKILLTAHALAEKGQRTSVLIGLSDLSREKKIYHTAFEVVEIKEERDLLLNKSSVS